MSNKNLSLDIKAPHHQSLIEQQYDLLVCGALWFNLNDVGIFILRGSEKRDWFQGQITNNIIGVDSGCKIDFCMCNASGHIQSIGYILFGEEEDIVVIPNNSIPYFKSVVEERIIMEDVIVEEKKYSMVTVQGAASEKCIFHATGQAELSHLSSFSYLESKFIRNDRTGYSGWDILVDKADEQSIQKILNLLPKGEEGTLLLSMFESGNPVLGLDIGEKTFPAELGSSFNDGYVSYNKGCYVGQEVLMRLHARGHTNRTWVALCTGSPLQAKTDILDNSGKVIGKTIKSYWSPKHSYITSAFIKNDYAWDSCIVSSTCSTSGELIEAEVRVIPLNGGK